MSDNKLFVTVSTPNGIVFEQEVEAANFLTDEGFITILKDHIPIIGNVYSCNVKLTKKDGKIVELKTDSGLFVKSKDNKLKMILNSCEEDIKNNKNNNDNNKIILNNKKTINSSYVEITLNNK